MEDDKTTIAMTVLTVGERGTSGVARLGIHQRVLWLLCALVAHWLLADAAFAERDVSRFERTVLYLQVSDEAVRAEFAILALDRLAHVYAAEAELARDEYAREKQDAQLLGWSAAVERYAAQLPDLSRAVEEGAPVLIAGGGLQGVTLGVDGRLVSLVHPRPDQQGAFERDLLHLFCARQPCDEFTPGTEPVAAIPVSRAEVEPEWSFTTDGAICAHGGLTVVFARRENLADLRRFCRQLVHELLVLADEIAWQARYAVEVDWPHLSIGATVRRPEHRVQLNAAGDSVLIEAPILHASPGLLTDTVPWLRDRLIGQQSQLQLEAIKYGWQ